MDAAQIKKFAQDLQKQTDTVIFRIEHHHHDYLHLDFVMGGSSYAKSYLDIDVHTLRVFINEEGFHLIFTWNLFTVRGYIDVDDGLETKFVGDKFEMLVSIILITKIPDILAHTSIQKFDQV